MKIFIETERLIIRELLPTDDEAMFELDSDKEVHKYLGNKPVTTIEQSRVVIALIRKQYEDNGIGRWAMIEKETGTFIGWTGLKLITERTNNHINYYDIGYRLIRKHWGKGYAYESAKASIDYGFNKLQLKEIYGMANAHNLASKKILIKSGLKHLETFELEGELTDWYKIVASIEIKY
jgi:ribosomal-protein-alanine N-acetyltransferase